MMRIYDDFEAVRVIDRLEAEGRCVPGDVSLAAVQNMGPGSARRPTVAGCPIPGVGMAEASVTLLLEALSNEAGDARDQLLESSLVEADSASAPAGDPARPAGSA